MIFWAHHAPLWALLVAVFHATTALGIVRIVSVPATINADTEIEVSVRYDQLDEVDKLRNNGTHYSLFAAPSPPGWANIPVCVLANHTKIDVTSVKIKIPADAFPSTDGFTLSTFAYSNNDFDSPTGSGLSDVFTLEGGAGKWARSWNGTLGAFLSLPNYFPCSSYSCIRDCLDKHYDDRQGTKTYNQRWQNSVTCANGCPGVTMPLWEDVKDADGSVDPSATNTVAKTSTWPTTSSTDGPISTSSSSQTPGSPSQTPSGAGRGVPVGASWVVVVVAGLLAAKILEPCI